MKLALLKQKSAAIPARNFKNLFASISISKC